VTARRIKPFDAFGEHDVVPGLLSVWDGRATDPALVSYRARPDLDALVETLRGWDHRMERTSPEAVIFHAYVYFLTRHLLADDFSALFDPILEAEPMYLLKLTSLCVRDAIPQSDVFWDGTRSETTALALEETAHWLMARFGGTETSRYTWADFHGSRFRSVYGAAFDNDWIPTDGGDGTVNVASSRFFDGETPYERIDVGGGAVYRMVARFRDDGTPEAYFQMPRGVSGVPGDPFYENLHEDWVEHRYRRLRFERSEVEDGAAETFTIDP
jgi:penicillin amidase